MYLRVHSEINSFCLYRDLQTNSGTCFYVKCLELYINGFVSTSSTKNGNLFFQISNSLSSFWPKTDFFFFFQKNSEAWILIKLHYVNQWIRHNDLYKQMENFLSNSQFRFQIIVRKPKNIQTAWILIKVLCAIYQWIWLDKLYKLSESLLPISEQFFELTKKMK